MWLCITSLILMMSVTDAGANDDRARQRAEARVIKQYEKFEGWQEKASTQVDRLHLMAQDFRRVRSPRGRENEAERIARLNYAGQLDVVERSIEEGERLYARIVRACQRMEERWPPVPPECEEEEIGELYSILWSNIARRRSNAGNCFMRGEKC